MAWRKLAIGLGVVILIGAGVASIAVPVRYEAFALLKVSSRQPSVLARATEIQPEEFAVFKRTQVQLMLSSTVLQRTVSEPEINRLSIVHEHDDEPAAWLKHQLLIDYPDDAEVLRVAIQGSQPDELVKIVDMVVDKYLKEVVQHEHDLRNDHELKLQRTFDTYTAEVKTQTDTLHKLETLHKTSSTEAAQVRRKLELETLGQLMAQRARLANQLMDNSMAIMLMEARRDTADEVRTADSPAAANNLSLPLLEKQKDYLEAMYKTADANVAEQAKVLANLDEFNVAVVSKLEELHAKQRITSDLRAALDRIAVERLAPERIIQVDTAVLADGSGDAPRKYGVLSVAAVVGLGLIAVGMVRRRPRQG